MSNDSPQHINLERCPFCRGEAEIKRHAATLVCLYPIKYRYTHLVGCKVEKCLGHTFAVDSEQGDAISPEYPTPKEAAEAWNTRAETATPVTDRWHFGPCGNGSDFYWVMPSGCVSVDDDNQVGWFKTLVAAETACRLLNLHTQGLRLNPVAMTVIPAPSASVVEAALRDLLNLYDSDEGCRSAPEYVAARKALLESSKAPAPGELEEKLNKAYSERAYAAAALARMALMNGYKAGTGLDGSQNDPEWRVVLYVDTPMGQVSWHIAPNDQHILWGLPEYDKPWDGTFRSRDGSFAFWNNHTPDPRDETIERLVEALEYGEARLAHYTNPEYTMAPKHRRDTLEEILKRTRAALSAVRKDGV